MIEFIDQLNRTISFSTHPSRIISLVPSQTELLVDLGFESKIVGITKFCVHPRHLKKKITVVGGTKNVHIDKIKELSPDIIICNKEENTETMVTELETIAPVWVSDIRNISDCIDMTLALGTIFSKEFKANAIADSILKELDTFNNFIRNNTTLKAAYLIWKDPYMVAGKSTFIDQLLQLNKFENIFSKRAERYPEILSMELQNADLILLSTEPFPFKEKHINLLKSKLGSKKILLVDGEYFSWYGSRLVKAKAFKYFKKLHSKL